LLHAKRAVITAIPLSFDNSNSYLSLLMTHVWVHTTTTFYFLSCSHPHALVALLEIKISSNPPTRTPISIEKPSLFACAT
jgi:hypothetical protein